MEVLIRVTSGPHSGEERLIDWEQPFVIGRSSRVPLSMSRDLLLSREHFRIENGAPGCYLVDPGSTNGTKVNGLRVERILLRDGDIITAGDSVFIVHFAQGSGEINEFTNCAGCGSRRDKTQAITSGQSATPYPSSAESLWLCRDCRDLRIRFPKTHPDYLIEEYVGGGGMGDVYRARQLSRNRPVAIKMMSANSALGEKASGYFQREIGVLRDLLMPGGQSHPSIVAFYELYDIDSQFQLIMEYVDGKNALDWLKTLDQPLPWPAAALIGRHLLSALDYAHSKGYVHRDVKPSNLLVMGSLRRPRVKLSDFGLAKSFAESDGLITLTRQGDIGGSIGFISPDHIRDFRDVREPADIYSAGATLYYLLTGHYPYLGFDPRKPEAYEMILEHPPVPLRAYRPDAPEGLERVLLKSLQKQPRDRYKSAHAMAEALRPFIEPATS